MAHPGRWLLLALLLLAALAGGAAWRSSPPAALPPDAPEDVFSAGRALALLRRIDPDGAPRTVRSAAHDRAREVVLAELRRLGLSPTVQETLGCGSYGTCTPIHNVVARLGGPGRAVLLMAHYDSVPAGPGAADDGAGVAAVLEIARVLGREPPGRPVILLVDDAEEAGLVGAAAFLDEHPWAKDVAAVVNLEARGTRGPSLLFEVVGGTAFSARLARTIPRPVTSSLFAGVYRRLPNNTDLSLFRRLGVPGVNFAFIDGAERYHTPGDDLAHLDPASVQHHGDSALAMVRAFAAEDPDRAPPGDAVFFDVLSLAVVVWPQGASAPLAAAGLLLAAGGGLILRRRGRLGWRALARALVAFAAGPAAGALLALGLHRGLAAAGALPRPFVAHPGPALAAFWCAGLAAAGAAAAWARRAGFEASSAAVALGFSGLALAAALAFPPASYLFVVPALVAGAGLLAAAALPAAAAPAAVASALAAGAVLLPVSLLLYPALGVGAAPAFAALVALAVSPLSAFAAGMGVRARRAAAAPALACLAAAGWALFLPHATAERPEAMNVVFHQDADSGAARWLVDSAGGLPEGMRRAAPFSGEAVSPFPWQRRPAFAAPAAALAVAPPELELLESTAGDDLRTVLARLRSPRGALTAAVLLPAGPAVVSVEIDGRPALMDEKLRRFLEGHRLIRRQGMPSDGVLLHFVIAGAQPVTAHVIDETPGLPPGGEGIAAARPPSALPIQGGDVTLVTRTVRL